MSVELVNATKVQSDLARIASRALRPEPMLELALTKLEHAEEALWAHLGGRFEQTGRLRASLTDREAWGAIREVHGSEATFGTRAWWGIFATGDARGHGDSEVLITATQAEAQGVGQSVLRHLLEGIGS